MPRPDCVFSQHYPSEGGTAASVKQEEDERRPGRLGRAVLGEEAVDFTIAAPIVPEGSVFEKVWLWLPYCSCLVGIIRINIVGYISQC